jgi:hypothetical protein
MKQRRLKTLKGSCQCGEVQFEVKSNTYYPYQLCYCSICRKSAGGGGFAINLGADFRTLKIHRGQKRVTFYHARVKNSEDRHAHRSTGQRHYCRDCGTFLWLYDPSWPELVHPFASCIDTELPVPPEKTHIMLEFKAPWVKPDFGARDKKFKRYPKEAIADWHERVIDRAKR